MQPAALRLSLVPPFSDSSPEPPQKLTTTSHLAVIVHRTTAMNDDDYDSGGDSTDGDDETVDSCEAYISFESTRDPSSKLEESISFSWPGIYDDDDNDDDDDDDEDEDGNGGSVDDGGGSRRRRGRKLRKVILSTLLEEGDLSPLFDGATWAGTRLWAAAVRAPARARGLFIGIGTAASLPAAAALLPSLRPPAFPAEHPFYTAGSHRRLIYDLIQCR